MRPENTNVWKKGLRNPTTTKAERKRMAKVQRQRRQAERVFATPLLRVVT